MIIRIGLVVAVAGSWLTPPRFGLAESWAGQSDPEQALWNDIQNLHAARPASQPARDRFELALQRRRALLERLRQYGSIYPGGAHRAESCRLELSTLFEIGSLTDGRFDALRRQIESYMRHPPCTEATHEAAYWALVLNRMKRADQRQRTATSQPTTSRLARSSEAEERLESYAAYIERFPDSRYSVGFCERLFERALAAGDTDGMSDLVARLSRDFPDHAVTARLRGRLDRENAVAQPFWLTFANSDGEPIDTRCWTGSVVIIVVWDSHEPRCAKRIRDVEAFRRRQNDLKVAGVNLDERRSTMTATADDLEIRWPQFNDGRGRANAFARTWGVNRVPLVFVIDRRGRLLGARAGDDWKALARKALEN